MREIRRTYGSELALFAAALLIVPAMAVVSGLIGDPAPGILLPISFLIAALLVVLVIRRAVNKPSEANEISKKEIEDFAEEPAPGEDLAEAEPRDQSSRAVPPR